MWPASLPIRRLAHLLQVRQVRRAKPAPEGGFASLSLCRVEIAGPAGSGMAAAHYLLLRHAIGLAGKHEHVCRIGPLPDTALVALLKTSAVYFGAQPVVDSEPCCRWFRDGPPQLADATADFASLHVSG